MSWREDRIAKRMEALLCPQPYKPNVFIKFLLWVGLVRLYDVDSRARGFPYNGWVRWPIRISPWPMWKTMWRYETSCWIKYYLTTREGSMIWNIDAFRMFGVFHNPPNIIKWEKGRLLPRRWGFHIWGIEIGDRG